MHLLWESLRRAVPLIVNGDPNLLSVIWFTVQVAAIATACAAVIGVPIGLRSASAGSAAAGRSKSPRTRASVCRRSSSGCSCSCVRPAGPARLAAPPLTKRAVFIAQTVLALPYVVALTAAAVQGLPPGLLAQARLLGAGRRQLWCSRCARRASG